MQIALFHNDESIREMIRFSIESKLPLLVKCYETTNSLIELFLEKNETELKKQPEFIILNETNEVYKLLNCIQLTHSKCPVLLLSENKKCTELFPEINYVDYPQSALNDIEALVEKAISHYDKNYSQTIENFSEYTRIHTSLLSSLPFIASPIYIKLSEKKIIRIFSPGDQFSEIDNMRYLHKKKIEFFYVKKEETSEIVKEIRSFLQAQSLEDPTGSKAPIFKYALSDLVLELIEQQTPDENALELTHEVINNVYSFIKENLDFEGFFEKLDDENKSTLNDYKKFKSRHSILVANLACIIGSKLKFDSKSSFEKFTYAAFFHDIGLNSLNPLMEESVVKSLNLSDSQVNELHQHPSRSIEILNKNITLPKDASLIILQHHEKSDGTGYPNKLDHKKISPLSAIFIVAHDIVDLKFNQSLGTDEVKIILQSYYQHGFFKTIVDALIL